MKKSSSKIKKIRKIIFTILIISLIIFIILLSQYERILKNQNSLEYETQKKTITEFQTERWNEIRKAVFGAGADSLSDVLNVNIATMSVQANNEYFNWADTSKLGITPWNGSTESISTTRTETESYSDSYINGATNAKTSVSESITYTVIDVNNAEQLRWALEQYHSSASNIKINLKSDIDLNGQNGKVWQSIKLSRANTNDVGWLYFEGNNHTIYNMKNCGSGYTHGNGFFGDISNKTFIAKNLKFVSSMVINNVVGQETDIKGMGTLFGVVNNQPSKYGVYIDNVKAISVFMQTSDKVGTAGGGGLIGRLNHAAYNDNVFIKNCASEKVYIAGIDHVGGFSGCICNANRDDGYHVKYNAEFPEQPEAFLKKAAIFPTMIENCFSVDSEVFSTGADSGAFISCGGVFIVRNCFTNNTIYANSETGAFIGKLFTRVYDNNPTDSTPYSDSLYDDAGVRSVSLYMENCYSSGIIEGNKNIGGFIGITNFTQYDCTSAIIKNCYAVGEVGDITTNTDNNSLNTSTLGGFIGDYTSRSTGVKFINCYYDKQTTGMRERGIGYVSDNSTGSIEGLTGTYTQGSTLKGGTPGLTGKTGNIVSMLDSESWVQKKGLYPQLAVFDSKASEIFKEDADLVRY